jgi:hypothetical protein
VSWSSKKQPTVSRSSCESEYRALAFTTAEVKWLRHLLRDLHVSSSSPPVILCDNQSSIFLAVNPVSHKRSKHIDLDYHFVREPVASRELKIRYVPTHLQIADMFTKSLGQPAFIFFRSKLCISDSETLGLRGGITDIEGSTRSSSNHAVPFIKTQSHDSRQSLDYRK